MSTRYIVRFGFDYPAAGGAVGTLIRAPRSFDENPFPQVLGGVTLGPTADSLTALDAAGWVTGDAEALRGRWRRANDAALPYRINLPDGPGIYRVGAGVAASSFLRARWRMNDGVGGPTRVDVSFSGAAVFGADEPTNLDQWAWLTATNAAANAGAIDADAFTPTPPIVEAEFASGVMEFLNGGFAGGGFASEVSFIAFEKVGGDPPPPVGPSAAVLHYLRESQRLAGLIP